MINMSMRNPPHKEKQGKNLVYLRPADIIRDIGYQDFMFMPSQQQHAFNLEAPIPEIFRDNKFTWPIDGEARGNLIDL
jgi:hypothetical protein